jgi:polyisoprenoid-binding protein YceI
MLQRCVLLLLVAIPLAASAAADSYTLDPYHTFPTFTVDHLGISTIYGRFNRSSGKFTLDRPAKTASIELVVEAASVDTGDSDRGPRARSRDEHLRSADFFNAAEFPRVVFKSDKVTFNGETPLSIEGTLTLLGVSKPVTLTVERFKCNPASANSKERCGGSATGKIKRSEYGMKTGIPSIGDEITLLIGIEGLKD